MFTKLRALASALVVATALCVDGAQTGMSTTNDQSPQSTSYPISV